MVKLYTRYFKENYDKLKEYNRKRYWQKQLAYNPEPDKYNFKFSKGKFIIKFI